MQRTSCSVQHIVCNMQHAACNMQRVSCSVKHATCASNVKHAMYSMQCVACNAHHAPRNGAQAGGRAECAPVEMLRMRQERLRRAAENIIRVVWGVHTCVRARTGSGDGRYGRGCSSACAAIVARFRVVHFAHVAWWQLWVARCASEIIISRCRLHDKCMMYDM
jgi:hypothetical protein